MDIIEIFLMSLSLSVDTIVVSMSGSVTLGKIRPPKVFSVHVIGFLILLYIGGTMAWSGIRPSGEDDVNLCGLRHLFLAAVATSIDAFAVGVSLAMSGVAGPDIRALTASVGTVTVLAAAAGVSCGSLAGRKFGRPAKTAGGIVLIAIGVKLLCGAI